MNNVVTCLCLVSFLTKVDDFIDSASDINDKSNHFFKLLLSLTSPFPFHLVGLQNEWCSYRPEGSASGHREKIVAPQSLSFLIASSVVSFSIYLQ